MSQTGLMSIGFGTRIEIWKDALIEKQTKPYLTHRCRSQKIHCLKFCPYEDVLGIGHEGGISQIVVPGSGEPNFDSYVAHPFQNKKARRESEVAHLLDKLPPEMISLNPEQINKARLNSLLTYTLVTRLNPIKKRTQMRRLKWLLNKEGKLSLLRETCLKMCLIH